MLRKAVAMTFLCCTGVAWAQGSSPEFTAPGTSALEIARDVVANEVKLIDYGQTFLRYKVHTKDDKGDQVRDVVETRDGTVARVVERGDRPLTPEENAMEQARLQAMLNSPDTFRKHIQKDQSGKKMAVSMVGMLPEAMVFRFTEGQPQRADRPAGSPPEIVLDFKPNPNWNPPTVASSALTGLEGRCWIDARTHHLIRMEADLFQGVNFGLGIFAHLYPGGTFVVEQIPVGEGRWIVNRFKQDVTVRAMMVKTIHQKTDLYASDFIPIRDMGYQEAIHLLLDTSLPLPSK